MATTAIYTVESTDGSATLVIQPRTVNGASGVLRNTDLTLYGNAATNWGEKFNENFYRLIENFAVEEDPLNLGNPKNENDSILTIGQGINVPILGQLWYNKSDDHLYLQTEHDLDVNNPSWIQLPTSADIAAILPINISDVTNLQTELDGKVDISGDTMTGLLIVNAGIEIPSGQKLTLSSIQTDPGAIYKYEPAVDESHTRIQVSDNTQSTDMLDIGWDDGTWHSACSITTTGVITTIGGISANGTLDLNSNNLINLSNPVNPNDAVNLTYADTHYLKLDGTNSMSGALDLNSNRLLNVADPTVDTDGMSLGYADARYVEIIGDTMTGALGIGASSPHTDYLLWLYQTNNLAAYNAYTKFNNVVTGNATNDGFDIGLANSGNAVLKLYENQDMYFYTNNTLRFGFGSSGAHTYYNTTSIDFSNAILTNAPTPLSTDLDHVANVQYVNNQIAAIPSSTISVTSFTTSGTWTKPAFGNYVIVEVWGGGGGGGRDDQDNGGGGGGGSYSRRIYAMTDLPATVSVQIGSGGTGRSINANGGAGTDTLFTNVSITDTIGYAGGGGGGNDASGGGGGGGGGQNAAGSSASGCTAGAGGGTLGIYLDGGNGGDGCTAGSIGDNSVTGGGGGGGSQDGDVTGFRGGSSVYGGGGGASSGSSNGTSGGLSVYGGAGGSSGGGGGNASNGSFPGGGGGGARSGISGDGANGFCIVRVIQ